MNVQNALAATGASHGRPARLHDIRQGLRTFTTSYFMAPGRLNMFELDGYRVIVDYAPTRPPSAHWASSSTSLAEPSTRSPAAGHRPPHQGDGHRR